MTNAPTKLPPAPLLIYFIDDDDEKKNNKNNKKNIGWYLFYHEMSSDLQKLFEKAGKRALRLKNRTPRQRANARIPWNVVSSTVVCFLLSKPGRLGVFLYFPFYFSFLPFTIRPYPLSFKTTLPYARALWS